ncbi:MAG: Fimbrial protein precursor [Betaproteobacteria bacterium ADurb.Bin341]|nr:MAG: Fimbrial protein precursor [Betaproteobacteria bacterium ADurb.Bin341]
MFCTSCGQQNPDGARFCSTCGAGLETGAAGGSAPARKTSGGRFPVWIIVILVLFFCAIPVLGILAAIAIPAYHDYTVKAKMAEVGSVGLQARDSVERYVLEHGKLPDSLEASGFSVASQQIQSVSIDRESGVISLVIGFPPHQGKTLKFVPTSADGKTITSWKCGSDEIPERHWPVACR